MSRVAEAKARKAAQDHARWLTPEYRTWKKAYDRKRYLDPKKRANDERVRAAYLEQNKEKMRDYRKDWSLQKRFGLTLAEYRAKVVAQRGACAVCKRVPKGKGLHVDHDHRTGKIRGLLCFNCNVVIGLSKDDHYILKRLTRYVMNGGF